MDTRHDTKVVRDCTCAKWCHVCWSVELELRKMNKFTATLLEFNPRQYGKLPVVHVLMLGDSSREHIIQIISQSKGVQSLFAFSRAPGNDSLVLQSQTHSSESSAL